MPTCASGVRRDRGRAKAQEDWVDHVNEIANRTLYPRANSWYMGANVPGKKRVFMPYIGGWRTYRDKCNEIAAEGYAGFAFTRTPTPVEQSETTYLNGMRQMDFEITHVHRRSLRRRFHR